MAPVKVHLFYHFPCSVQHPLLAGPDVMADAAATALVSVRLALW